MKFSIFFLLSFFVSFNLIANDKFFLEPYKTNYILPFSYKSGENYNSYSLSDTYSNLEFEFQISLKYNFYNNLFGFNESYNVVYSQKTWWQLYSESSPFREFNFNPEFFVSIPFTYSVNNFKFRNLKLSFVHNSNGKGNIEENNLILADKLNLKNNSRSHNYFEASSLMSFNNIDIEISSLINYLGSFDLSDNPDIYDYYGYLGLKLNYKLDDYNLMFSGRINPLNGNGNLEVSTYYTINKKENFYLYFKYFYGYGESLIDYNNRINKVGIGIAFNLPNLF